VVHVIRWLEGRGQGNCPDVTRRVDVTDPFERFTIRCQLELSAEPGDVLLARQISCCDGTQAKAQIAAVDAI